MDQKPLSGMARPPSLATTLGSAAAPRSPASTARRSRRGGRPTPPRRRRREVVQHDGGAGHGPGQVHEVVELRVVLPRVVGESPFTQPSNAAAERRVGTPAGGGAAGDEQRHSGRGAGQGVADAPEAATGGDVVWASSTSSSRSIGSVRSAWPTIPLMVAPATLRWPRRWRPRTRSHRRDGGGPGRRRGAAPRTP